ncbi:hypothetical protein J2T13_000568 [Paenibacillus sp. DS2015]
MRDFSWKYFVMTGDVDAYMLFKEAGSTISDEIADNVVGEETVNYEENE